MIGSTICRYYCSERRTSSHFSHTLVDSSSDLVMSLLVLHLCQFATFTRWMVWLFILRPCTFCMSSCWSIFTLITFVLNAWSCASLEILLFLFRLSYVNHTSSSSLSFSCLPYKLSVKRFRHPFILCLCWISVLPFQSVSKFSSFVAHISSS